MDDRFYPCIFSMNDYSETDNVLDFVSYYRFKSEKSKLFYIISIDFLLFLIFAHVPSFPHILHHLMIDIYAR